MIIGLSIGIVVALILGVIIGASLRKSNKAVNEELAETKKMLTHYQNTVNEHVHKTHEIMENIYQQFTELQKHSQDYSVKLNLDASRQSLLQPKAYPSNEKENEVIDQPNTQLPKDYAEEK